MREKWLVTLLLLPLLLLGAETQKNILTAEVAYAKPMQFDYDKDGTMNTIQMWAKIVIDKTDKGYEGYFRRFMKDVDTGKAVLGYADINMLPDQPYGKKLPVSQVEKHGKTILFKAGSKRYILMDGGPDFRSDTAIANDGNRDYIVELYAGDIKVSQ